MDDVAKVYVGAMRWNWPSYASGPGVYGVMRDVLCSYGVTWKGRLSYDEVESMYLGLLVGFGDDICE